MKKVKLPIRHEGSGKKIGELTMMSDIDDILFAIEDEIDKKEIHDKIMKLRNFVKNNKEAGYNITYDTLTYSFDKSFIDECIKKQILIKNGKEYICT